MDESPPVTPSQPGAPLTAPVKTEAEAAVATGDVAAFREARRAEKTASTAPKGDSRSPTSARPTAPTGATSTAASEAADPTSPDRPRGNAKTRLAEVDSEVVALKAKLAERDALLRQSRDPVPPAAPAAKPAPSPGPKLPAEMESYEAYLSTHPHASLEEFIDARQDARTELKEQQREATRRETARAEATTKKVEAFTKRVNESAANDPSLLERVAPAILALKPVIALKPGEKADQGNVIATELLDSPVPDKVMEALSNPETFARLMSMQQPAEIIRAISKIEARYLTDDDAPAAPTFKTSSTPTPPTTLGKRPTDTLAATEAAIRDGDVTAFKAARNAERAARFNRR